MKPTTKRMDNTGEAEHIPLQEQFIRQVEDDSLSAAQVLTEQKQAREPDDPAPLFVP